MSQVSLTFLPSSPPFAVLPPYLLSLIPPLSSPYTFFFPFPPLILLRYVSYKTNHVFPLVLVVILRAGLVVIIIHGAFFFLTLQCFKWNYRRFRGRTSYLPPPYQQLMAKVRVRISMWCLYVCFTRALCLYITNPVVPFSLLSVTFT